MLKDYIAFKEYKRIPLTGNCYEINIKGVVRETFSKKVLSTGKNELSEIHLTDKTGEWFDNHSLASIMAITFRNLVAHPNTWSKFEIIYKDGDPSNFKLTNTIWKSPLGNITHPLYPGFTYVPGFSRYLINRDGLVISTNTGEYLSPYTDANGYLIYGVQPDVGKRTIVGMHRLLALAFLDYPFNIDSLDVNHLDGIKDNNELINLEWATRARNNQHAQEMGLNNSQAVLVRNVLTGEIKRYYSMSDCARDLGITQTTIINRINSNPSNIYNGYMQFKLENDTTPFIDDNFIHGDNTRSIRMVCNTSNAERVFKSVTEAALWFNITPGGLSYHLKKSRTGIEYKGYFLEYISHSN